MTGTDQPPSAVRPLPAASPAPGLQTRRGHRRRGGLAETSGPCSEGWHWRPPSCSFRPYFVRFGRGGEGLRRVRLVLSSQAMDTAVTCRFQPSGNTRALKGWLPYDLAGHK